MKDSVREEQMELLVKAILAIRSEEECRCLLEDLCTIREVQDLAQRIEVARMLRAQTTYNDIAQATGASTATISRVNRCLMYGAGGYRQILERLEEEDD